MHCSLCTSEGVPRCMPHLRPGYLRKTGGTPFLVLKATYCIDLWRAASSAGYRSGLLRRCWPPDGVGTLCRELSELSGRTLRSCIANRRMESRTGVQAWGCPSTWGGPLTCDNTEGRRDQERKRGVLTYKYTAARPLCSVPCAGHMGRRAASRAGLRGAVAPACRAWGLWACQIRGCLGPTGGRGHCGACGACEFPLCHVLLC
mmetsp:Transcript_3416/g.6516  ORF Transcript_3416/g.6516 Transcript_3416/m.6516 type:complete len:203 (-) Transcript_3416:2253-2861(-)